MADTHKKNLKSAQAAHANAIERAQNAARNVRSNETQAAQVEFARLQNTVDQSKTNISRLETAIQLQAQMYASKHEAIVIKLQQSDGQLKAALDDHERKADMLHEEHKLAIAESHRKVEAQSFELSQNADMLVREQEAVTRLREQLQIAESRVVLPAAADATQEVSRLESDVERANILVHSTNEQYAQSQRDNENMQEQIRAHDQAMMNSDATLVRAQAEIDGLKNHVALLQRDIADAADGKSDREDSKHDDDEKKHIDELTKKLADAHKNVCVAEELRIREKDKIDRIRRQYEEMEMSVNSGIEALQDQKKQEERVNNKISADKEEASKKLKAAKLEIQKLAAESSIHKKNSRDELQRLNTLSSERLAERERDHAAVVKKMKAHGAELRRDLESRTTTMESDHKRFVEKLVKTREASVFESKRKVEEAKENLQATESMLASVRVKLGNEIANRKDCEEELESMKKEHDASIEKSSMFIQNVIQTHAREIELLRDQLGEAKDREDERVTEDPVAEEAALRERNQAEEEDELRRQGYESGDPKRRTLASPEQRRQHWEHAEARHRQAVEERARIAAMLPPPPPAAVVDDNNNEMEIPVDGDCPGDYPVNCKTEHGHHPSWDDRRATCVPRGKENLCQDPFNVRVLNNTYNPFTKRPMRKRRIGDQ